MNKINIVLSFWAHNTQHFQYIWISVLCFSYAAVQRIPGIWEETSLSCRVGLFSYKNPEIIGQFLQVNWEKDRYLNSENCSICLFILNHIWRCQKLQKYFHNRLSHINAYRITNWKSLNTTLWLWNLSQIPWNKHTESSAKKTQLNWQRTGLLNNSLEKLHIL